MDSASIDADPAADCVVGNYVVRRQHLATCGSPGLDFIRDQMECGEAIESIRQATLYVLPASPLDFSFFPRAAETAQKRTKAASWTSGLVYAAL